MNDSNEDPLGLSRVDTEIRIRNLKKQLEEIAGDEFISWEADDCPPEIQEMFLEEIVAFETAPLTEYRKELTEAGMTLPPPDELDDVALSEKLWEVIDGLDRLNTWLSGTDHLSDRMLYEHLWRVALREPVQALSEWTNGGWILDLSAVPGPDPGDPWLVYYADQSDRLDWPDAFPGEPLPDHVDPPHNRDAFLPGPGEGLSP